MSFDFKAAVEAANSDAPEPFVFTIGDSSFEFPMPVDVAAVELLGAGRWAGCVEHLLGGKDYGRFLVALKAEGLTFSLDAAKALMREYMAHGKTDLGESSASTES